MKKFYSLLLMATALLIGMNLQAEVREVSSLAALKAALADATIETIYLNADLDYALEGDNACVNILRSVTIDGQGHKINGGGIRTGSTKSTLAINQGAPGNENWIDSVVLKNITLQNAISAGQALNVRCNLTKLVIDNCTIKTTGSGNNQPITFGGNQEEPVDVTINNSYISSGQAGYPLITFNPIALKTKNTTYKGYCALYFKGVNSSAGSGGSSVDADACDFDAPNMNEPAGGWNSFGTFAIADGGITFNLNNCGFNSQEIGSDQQQVFLFKYEGAIASIDPCVVHITGDNSYVNGDMLRDAQKSARDYFKENYDSNAWNHVLELRGGTYAQNPATMTSGDLAFIIPDGYEVIEMKTNQNGQETTLYRVRKTITTSYTINQDVEGEGAGQNEHTEFKITTDDEIAESIDEVVANYVEVSNNATLTVGENKTLEVTNGMDVKDGAQVVVEPGATVIVGEGGVVAEKAEGIVIESSETEPASFLLDPEVIVNTTPLLTVKMIANAGKEDEDWIWHRFAMPVNGITSWTKQNEAGAEITVPTYLQGWDYGKQDWDARTVDQMVPFLGYTLTYDQVGGVATTGETKVVYVFKGNLVGNLDIDLNFQNKGYNYFGNSYTAFIDAKTLLADVMNDPTIGGAVYMWDAVNQGYSAVTMRDLRDFPDRLEAFEKEVAPMQTFILQLRSDNKPSVFVDYKNAIWGNPRYGKVASAPARMVADNDTYAKITVTAENGKTDAVRLNENAQFSDEYENGMDADKFINSNNVNIYATVNGNNYSTVATDNLEGKMISLQTKKGSHYTLSFSHISGTEYAVKDMLTGIVTPMTADNTYEFVAGENTLNENRFMIVRRANMPTDAETVEATAARKGIYTIMGQYVGETDMFNTLPAGIYVVDGVKVVR